MTGQRMGRCAGSSAPSSTDRSGGRGQGGGRGGGRRHRARRGCACHDVGQGDQALGRGMTADGTAQGCAPTSAEDEVKLLKTRAERLGATLDELRRQIAELERARENNV